MTDLARYDELTAAMRRLAVDCDGHVFALGTHLNEMAGGLFRTGGYDSLAEYVTEALPIGVNQAYKAMRIARQFTEADVSRFGIEKCDAWLRYIAATPDEDAATDLHVARIPVVLEDGTRSAVAAASATRAQIDAAAALVRQSLEPALAEDVKRLFSAFTAVPGARVRVSTTGTISVSGFTPANACDLLTALAGAAGCST